VGRGIACLGLLLVLSRFYIRRSCGLGSAFRRRLFTCLRGLLSRLFGRLFCSCLRRFGCFCWRGVFHVSHGRWISRLQGVEKALNLLGGQSRLRLFGYAVCLQLRD